MKNHLSLLLLLSFLLPGAGQAQDAFLAKADAFLQKHVTNGLIDYGAVTGDPAFDELVDLIDDTDFTGWAPDQQKAYLINAYNLLTIKGVVDNYPVGSVQDVAGFFDRKRHVAGGKSMTLNELEKDVFAEDLPRSAPALCIGVRSKGVPAHYPRSLPARNAGCTVGAADPPGDE